MLNTYMISTNHNIVVYYLKLYFYFIIVKVLKLLIVSFFILKISTSCPISTINSQRNHLNHDCTV